MSLRRERDDPGALKDTGEGELRQVGKDGVERKFKVKVPGLAPLGKGTPETRADERPPQSDDPRSGVMRDVPPYGGG